MKTGCLTIERANSILLHAVCHICLLFDLGLYNHLVSVLVHVIFSWPPGPTSSQTPGKHLNRLTIMHCGQGLLHCHQEQNHDQISSSMTSAAVHAHHRRRRVQRGFMVKTKMKLLLLQEGSSRDGNQVSNMSMDGSSVSLRMVMI